MGNQMEMEMEMEMEVWFELWLVSRLTNYFVAHSPLISDFGCAGKD